GLVWAAGRTELSAGHTRRLLDLAATAANPDQRGLWSEQRVRAGLPLSPGGRPAAAPADQVVCHWLGLGHPELAGGFQRVGDLPLCDRGPIPDRPRPDGGAVGADPGQLVVWVAIHLRRMYRLCPVSLSAVG